MSPAPAAGAPPRGPSIAIDLPSGWRHRTDVPPFALIAQAHPWPERFVPNITVAVAPERTGVSPEDYLAEQLAGAVTTLAEPVLLDADVDRSSGRVSFLIAHATTGTDLTLAQHHVITTDGFVIAAAATAPDADWPALAVELLAAVRSVRRAP